MQFICDYAANGALNAVWFYLPAIVANAFPFFLYKVIGYEIPIDQEKKIGKQNILGKRTFGGFFAMLIGALIIGVIQGRTIESVYLGTGAFFGVLINSFIKRRIGIKEGGSLLIFDQIDYVAGATLFYISAYQLDSTVFVFGCIVSVIYHPIANYLLNKVDMKNLLKRFVK